MIRVESNLANEFVKRLWLLALIFSFPFTACSCDAKGSKEENCDKLTGECHCKRGYFGSDCAQGKLKNTEKYRIVSKVICCQRFFDTFNYLLL